MKKPRDLKCRWLPELRCGTDSDGRYIASDEGWDDEANAKALRKVAAWLLKAADWLEEKEES